MIKKIPDTIKDVLTGWCSGCGHGVVVRLLTEVIQELKLDEKIIIVMDVACGAFIESTVTYNYLGAAHGRPIITAAGVKRVRNQDIVVAHAGDGSAYSIGTESTIHVALRNENILALIVNNCVFGMTGGQMSPTSILGQQTTTSLKGREPERNGLPFDIIKMLKEFDIAYLARGSVHNPGEIRKCKRMLTRAIKKQMNNEGFCLLEVMSPCPTNWGLSPIDSINFMQNELNKAYELGEFIGGEDF